LIYACLLIETPFGRNFGLRFYTQKPKCFIDDVPRRRQLSVAFRSQFSTILVDFVRWLVVWLDGLLPGSLPW